MNNNTVIIAKVVKDKSIYDPGALIKINVTLQNLTSSEDTGIVELRAKHLNKQVGQVLKKEYSLNPYANESITLDWQAPADDFTGYLIEVELKDSDHHRIDDSVVAVDVSSSWTKFPRYGYVWNFTKDVNVAERIEKLKDYHINALEYYDWKYRHHKPVPENLDKWDDWSGREIYGDTVFAYISEAKQVNMVNMAYNMAYAAVSGYQEDGVEQDWALYFSEDNPRGTGHFMFKMADSTPTGITHLYFFDMRNKGWQDYIFKQMNKVFDVFGFDGWHSDTVGDWGEMQNAQGEKFSVTDTYTEFLNAAKAVIGEKYLVFNPVGAQGIENVNVSDVDVLYTEMWPWDKDRDGEYYDSYYALKKAIDRAREESGGKSLVVPAYMNYGYGQENPGQFFNTASVLLTAATVYAAGGSRIELGDNGNMLCHEYFPAQSLSMTPELERKIGDLYHFIVAYQNLLRDGQMETEQTIEVLDYPNNKYGKPNTIWTYAKQDETYEIVQMINLLGVSQDDWRANDGIKETPTSVEQLELKYYYGDKPKSVWLASPDIESGRSQELTFSYDHDNQGDFIRFTIPSLEYWNMIYMVKDK
ncbi:glycoside hydrolase family 66 protein [Globicatella sulfidifaciens]|uniref:Dextranase n=1 Tax=Globicatella sulfidifaciens TaxID=136093 RepID=A0A7X8C5R3_9LACT|nr:glycoside hydrolase family 66 protein [Globicatella sulfidifaciens]NLJ19487.1 dextranase [Globicatella sulfidifaciens]